MPIYTKNGDEGYSSIANGDKTPKSEPVFEVLGTLDELNCLIGVVLSSVRFSDQAHKFMLKMQDDLFLIGNIISSGNTSRNSVFKGKTLKVESAIDDLQKRLPRLTNFILPGGVIFAAYVHHARSVCRRLERRLVSLDMSVKDKNMIFIITYINRLSDFLFVLARFLNLEYGIKDNIWSSE